MKRSSRAVWVVLAVVVVGLGLLVDPLGWFGDPADSGSVTGPATVAPPPEDAPPVELVRGGRISEEGVAEAPAREAVDPLVEGGIASFRILEPSLVPAANAQVLVVRGEDIVADERTNDAGDVELTADGEPAALFVALAYRALERHEVVLTPGRQDVVLAAGGILAGRVVHEDGSSLGERRLSLDSDHPPTAVGDVPEVVSEALVSYSLWSGYAIVPTDDEGAFELRGLPASWSGLLRLRGIGTVVSTSHGEIAAGGGAVRLDEPVTDLVIRVRPRRVLHGRLVLRDDGSAVAGARLAARLRSPLDPSPSHTGATTDEDGRFAFTSQQDELSELELRLGGRFHESAPLLHLDAESLPADGDLGDVVVSEVRHVPFLLRDPEGSPIRGGVAVAVGVQSESTDAEGRSELRWVPRSVDHFDAEKKGFVPATADIPDALVAPVEVTMERATELTVRLLLPEESDPGQFKVVLRGDERITASPAEDAVEQNRHVSYRAIHILDFTGEPKDRYLCSQVDATTGTTIFYALRPSVEIGLEVQGITGEDVYHAEPVPPFAPGEHRTVEISLESGMIEFRGFVLDEGGDPLGFAVVQLGGSILDYTEDDGSFECFLPGPETGTLLVQHQSCTTLYLHDYAVPTDGRPVEFRLSPAYPLVIEVVDENGTPVPQAEVDTEYGGFTTNTHRLGGHRHRCSGMPAGPFVIRTQLAGRIYRQDHEPPVGEARVVVPVHGHVTGLVDAASTVDRAGRFLLVLHPQDDPAAMAVVEARDAAPDLRIEMPVVHPGRYEARLDYQPTKDERAAGRTESSSTPVTITVAPGKETEVRLALPADDG